MTKEKLNSKISPKNLEELSLHVMKNGKIIIIIFQSSSFFSESKASSLKDTSTGSLSENCKEAVEKFLVI